MIQKLIEQFLPAVARIDSDPNDADDLRLQKTLLTLGLFMFILAGALWGILYISFGQFIAGSIPLGYAIFSSLSLIVFFFNHKFQSSCSAILSANK